MRSHPLKLMKNRRNLELRRHFYHRYIPSVYWIRYINQIYSHWLYIYAFTNQVVNQRNPLPSHVVCAPTVNSLKLNQKHYYNQIRHAKVNGLIIVIIHFHYINISIILLITKSGVDYLTAGIFEVCASACAHKLTNCACGSFFVANHELTKWRFLIEFSTTR